MVNYKGWCNLHIRTIDFLMRTTEVVVILSSSHFRILAWARKWDLFKFSCMENLSNLHGTS